MSKTFSEHVLVQKLWAPAFCNGRSHVFGDFLENRLSESTCSCTIIHETQTRLNLFSSASKSTLTVGIDFFTFSIQWPIDLYLSQTMSKCYAGKIFTFVIQFRPSFCACIRLERHPGLIFLNCICMCKNVQQNDILKKVVRTMPSRIRKTRIIDTYAVMLVCEIVLHAPLNVKSFTDLRSNTPWKLRVGQCSALKCCAVSTETCNLFILSTRRNSVDTFTAENSICSWDTLSDTRTFGRMPYVELERVNMFLQHRTCMPCPRQLPQVPQRCFVEVSTHLHYIWPCRKVILCRDCLNAQNFTYKASRKYVS